MPAEFDSHFGTFFRAFMTQLMTIVPPDTNLPAAYDSGNDDQQAFVQNLALFFTGFLRVRLLYSPAGGVVAIVCVGCKGQRLDSVQAMPVVKHLETQVLRL